VGWSTGFGPPWTMVDMLMEREKMSHMDAWCKAMTFFI
jgi:hypothetical protein